MSVPLCGCPERQPEADPSVYACPCGAHCLTCNPIKESTAMSPEEIANHVSIMVAAMRDRADLCRGDAWHARSLLEPLIIAAAVTAYLASIERAK